MKKLNLFQLKKQKGSVLILSLLMLVVLTIIGVSSMSTSSLQEKMAGNFRDREIAFQAAEVALAAAENYVMSTINTVNLGNADGYYNYGSGPTSSNAYTGNWWTGTNSQILGASVGTAIAGVRSQPRFTIEARTEVGSKSGTDINIQSYGESSGAGAVQSYRITASGTGKSDSTRVILQSNYAKRI